MIEALLLDAGVDAVGWSSEFGMMLSGILWQ